MQSNSDILIEFAVTLRLGFVQSKQYWQIWDRNPTRRQHTYNLKQLAILDYLFCTCPIKALRRFIQK